MTDFTCNVSLFKFLFILNENLKLIKLTIRYSDPKILFKFHRVFVFYQWCLHVYFIDLTAALLISVWNILRSNLRISNSLNVYIFGVYFVSVINFSLALPWDRATKECSAYAQFAKGHYSRIKPWNNIDALAICLIRSMLTHRPDKRANIPTILSHEWCNMKFPHIGTGTFYFKILNRRLLDSPKHYFIRWQEKNQFHVQLLLI